MRSRGRSVKRRMAAGREGPLQRCGVRFELGNVRQQFLLVGPADEVVRDHLVGPQRRLAARVEADYEAGDDSAIGLNLNAPHVMAQETPAAEDVLEEPEEHLDQPAMAVDLGDDLGRRIQ